MTWSRFVQAWNRFFFQPIPAYSLGLFRIAFSAVALVTLLLLLPEARDWFGVHGTMPFEFLYRTADGPRLNVLWVLPHTDSVMFCFMGFSVLVALCLLVGFYSRVASVLMWICLTTLDHRNMFILHSGDTLLRNLSFFLMFAPSDRAFSIDRLLRIRKGVEPAGVPMITPSAQRMMQFQLCVMYFITVVWKLKGNDWLNGSAVFYTTQLVEFQRFPIPHFMHSLWFSKFASWATLIIEFGMATVVWIPALRYPMLLAGAGLHLGLEYSMNVPGFQWITLASYLLFLKPDFLTRVGVLSERTAERVRRVA